MGVLSLGLLLPVLAAAAESNEWRSLRFEHFVVRYEGDEAHASRMGRAAESLLGRAMEELGYRQRDGFWLWENRCRIRIYRARERFREGSDAPEWAGGRADYAARTIETYEGSETFADRILPHELTHLVFREFIGFKGEVPGWLDEGVAQWVSSRLAGTEIPAVPRAALGLGAMTSVDLRTADRTTASVVYAQSVAVVDFLIRTQGKDRFSDFCRRLRDGRSMDDALGFTYGAALRNIDALDRAWRKDREGRP
jgi:hypothetical protein